MEYSLLINNENLKNAVYSSNTKSTEMPFYLTFKQKLKVLFGSPIVLELKPTEELELIEHSLSLRCGCGYNILKDGEIFRLVNGKDAYYPEIYQQIPFNSHEEMFAFIDSPEFYKYVKPNYCLCYYMDSKILSFARLLNIPRGEDRRTFKLCDLEDNAIYSYIPEPNMGNLLNRTGKKWKSEYWGKFYDIDKMRFKKVIRENMKLLGTIINGGKSEVHELEGGFLQIIPVDSVKGSSFIHKDEIQEIAGLVDNQSDIEKIRNNFLKLIKECAANMIVKGDEHISFTFILYNDDDIIIQSNNMASRKILEYAYRNQ